MTLDISGSINSRQYGLPHCPLRSRLAGPKDAVNPVVSDPARQFGITGIRRSTLKALREFIVVPVCPSTLQIISDHDRDLEISRLLPQVRCSLLHGAIGDDITIQGKVFLQQR